MIRWTGASGSPTKNEITAAGTDRASTSDTFNPGTANPIPVPGAGSNYSYWVVTRLSASAGATTAINNIRWYTDGTNSLGTGVSLAVATATVYKQATGTTGTTGDLLNSSFYTSGLTPTTAANATAYTSAAPITVAGSIGSTTGDFGDFVVYQVAVTTTASPGVATESGITWQYDET